MRKLASAAVVLGVTLTLTAGAAVPSSTPSTAPVPRADPPISGPDFTPSNSKPRAWMLNILGSVLGAAMPNSWRAEQLANAHRYNHSWELLGAQFGTNPANPNYMGAPDSYEDYVLRKTELDIKGGTNGARFSGPAFAAKAWQKIGTALAAPFAYEIGASVGEGVVSLFGYNSEGLVCGTTDGLGQQALAFLSGVSCDQFSFVDEYVRNVDVVAGVSSGWTCFAEGQCLRITKQTTNGHSLSEPDVPSSRRWCIEVTGTPGTTSLNGVMVDPVNAEPSAGTTRRQESGQITAGHTCGTLGPEVGVLTVPYEDGPLVAIWWGSGVHVDVVEADPDPLRTVTCSIEGTDGNTYTAQSEPYRESSGGIAQPNCPALPEGVAPVHIDITEQGPQGAQELYAQDVTDEYLEWWNDYPECRTGACKLDLITLVNPSFPVSCFDVGDQCADWFEDPNRNSTYQCHYGIHTVALEECYVYAGVFQEERIAIGAPYSDPMTGEWSGAQNAPTPDRQAFTQLAQDPTGPRACRGMQADGFDPVAFVMRPVQCALEWAFVPRPAVIALAGEQVASSWAASGPGELVAIVEGWDFTVSASGCSRQFTWYPPMSEPVTMDLWNACDEPMATVAAISRAVVNVSLAVMVIVMIRRAVSGSVDFKGV